MAESSGACCKDALDEDEVPKPSPATAMPGCDDAAPNPPGDGAVAAPKDDPNPSVFPPPPNRDPDVAAPGWLPSEPPNENVGVPLEAPVADPKRLGEEAGPLPLSTPPPPPAPAPPKRCGEEVVFVMDGADEDDVPKREKDGEEDPPKLNDGVCRI